MLTSWKTEAEIYKHSLWTNKPKKKTGGANFTYSVLYFSLINQINHFLSQVKGQEGVSPIFFPPEESS